MRGVAGESTVPDLLHVNVRKREWRLSQCGYTIAGE